LQDTAGHVVVVGRGRVVADTTVEELIASASTGHVTLRTEEPERAAAELTQAGAEVGPPDAGGALTITGPPADQVVALLTRHAVPFSEVSAQRATLEQAYMRLTRDSTEFTGATR
jgi:ABC-2 type transport system ATP-binding protein